MAALCANKLNPLISSFLTSAIHFENGGEA